MSGAMHPSTSFFPRAAGEPGSVEAQVWQQVEAVCEQLAVTAVERDRRGGHAADERAAIARSGLLDLTVPRGHGGRGAAWSLFYRTLRRLAEVDSALAHLYGFHHLQLATVQIYGTADQQARWLRDTVDHRLFWGNALNPSDRRATARAVAGGYLIDGPKSYCSGSVGSDRLTVSAWHADTQSFLIAVMRTDAPGVHVALDWDAFGQKQTDSGSVTFQQVQVPDADVLMAPGAAASAWTSLRSQMAQHILSNLYAGLASGALQTGLRYTAEQARPWAASGVARSVDDPFTQLRFAELWVQTRGAVALVEQASQALDEAFAQGPDLRPEVRGEVAIRVAEAKVAAHRAAMTVTAQFFEQTGARSTSATQGLDRFWRNARVHTLHDPVDYKLRDIGRFALSGQFPEPSAYS